MKEFIEKLIGRLTELPTKAIDRYKGGSFGNWEGTDYFIKQSDAIEIVNQLAEEYAKDTNIQTIDVSELLGESVNDGWIACSGCSDCQHKECEHYGKV